MRREFPESSFCTTAQASEVRSNARALGWIESSPSRRERPECPDIGRCFAPSRHPRNDSELPREGVQELGKAEAVADHEDRGRPPPYDLIGHHGNSGNMPTDINKQRALRTEARIGQRAVQDRAALGIRYRAFRPLPRTPRRDRSARVQPPKTTPERRPSQSR